MWQQDTGEELHRKTRNMKYWLVKTESSTYSIDDLKKDKKTHWHGVRNYQARNFLKDMELGDLVLFYQSVNEPLGVSGVAKVVKIAYPDPSQFEKNSEYYEEKSSPKEPRWFCPDLKFSRKFKEIIKLADLKKEKDLMDMHLLKIGSRLSVQPVTEKEFDKIVKLAGNERD